MEGVLRGQVVISLNELLARGEILLHGRERWGSLHTALGRGAAGTFAIKVVSTGLTFLMSLFLTRLLGAGYGVYTYAITWVGLLSAPAVLGSTICSSERWQPMRSVLINAGGNAW